MKSSALPSIQRAEPRLTASLPIMVEWQTRQGATCRARGTTHDISLNGVYCYLEQPLVPGLRVRFHVVFPGDLTVSDSVNLRCTGGVLRSESLDRRFGVALSIETRQAIRHHGLADGSNRRAHARVLPLVTLPVVYPELRAIVRDLSLTGAFIEDDRPLPVGRVIDLCLGGDGGRSGIPVRAIVRRTEPHVGMAVEFVSITQDANRRLQEFLERHTAKIQIAS